MFRRLLTAILAVALGSIAWAADLSALKVFPNPVHVNRGDNQVTFDNGANVIGGDLRIYNSSGRVVLDTSLNPAATRFVWDLKNGDGKSVASGIYIYRLTAGDERTGKIGIIR